MPIPLVAAGTSSAWLPYLLALGAGGTYAMNRDRINRMAGSFNIPWPGRESAEERWLRTGSFDEPGTAEVITAAPGSTDSEFDGKTIVYPPGPLVHQPAGELVGTGGGNGGNGGDDDKRYWQNARWGALGEIPSVFSRLFDRASDVDPYEAGRIEREEQEWGPGGQPSASDQIDAYERSKWLQKTRNSPAQRSGAFSDDELWELQKKDRAFQDAQRNRTMDEFVEAYPQSQTAKEYAIRNRIPSSLDMEF
tara:strand:+ start:448 stop:1197 length:750 start_codon:yes stop_codon:yes gene_type:complete